MRPFAKLNPREISNFVIREIKSTRNLIFAKFNPLKVVETTAHGQHVYLPFLYIGENIGQKMGPQVLLTFVRNYLRSKLQIKIQNGRMANKPTTLLVHISALVCFVMV